MTMQGEEKVHAALIKTAKQGWDDIKVEVMNRHIITLIHGAKAVFEADGWYTKIFKLLYNDFCTIIQYLRTPCFD